VSQRPRSLTPLASGWHLLGAQIRHWRLVRGLSQAELAALTHDSRALIAKVEKADRRPRRELVHRIDTALDAEGALEDLWAAANRAPDPNAGLPPGKANSAGSPTGGRVGEAEVEGLSVMAQASPTPTTTWPASGTGSPSTCWTSRAPRPCPDTC
jgi:transcriptional regulator with XRE-family HTH domain